MLDATPHPHPPRTHLQVNVRSHEEWNFNSFQLVVPGPGEFMKATHALEASIKIHPTVILTNALPYHMDGYVLAFPNPAAATHSATVPAAGPPAPAPTAALPRCATPPTALLGPPPSMAGMYRRLSVAAGSRASTSDGGEHVTEPGEHVVDAAAQREEQIRLGFEVLMKLEALMVLLHKKVSHQTGGTDGAAEQEGEEPRCAAVRLQQS